MRWCHRLSRHHASAAAVEGPPRVRLEILAVHAIPLKEAHRRTRYLATGTRLKVAIRQTDDLVLVLLPGHGCRVLVVLVTHVAESRLVVVAV